MLAPIRGSKTLEQSVKSRKQSARTHEHEWLVHRPSNRQKQRPSQIGWAAREALPFHTLARHSIHAHLTRERFEIKELAGPFTAKETMPRTDNHPSPPVEFSRPIEVSRLKGTVGQDFAIKPDAQETANLTALFKASKLSKVQFNGTIRPFGNSEWELDGQLGATIVQPCVVTLAPVTTRIDTKVHRLFVREIQLPDEVEIAPDHDVDLELLGSTIDLGIIATEELALSIPEYPRADGAELARVYDTATDDAGQIRPFDALKPLRDRLSDS